MSWVLWMQILGILLISYILGATGITHYFTTRAKYEKGTL